MKRILLAVLFALSIIPVYASPPAPAAYTIDNPRIVVHKKKKMVQVKWYQYVQSSPKLVIAFKLTNTRLKGFSDCSEVDWAQYLKESYSYQYCYDLFNSRVPESKWITVTDKKWRKGDMYFMIQYDFTSHNAPYGPYIPR